MKIAEAGAREVGESHASGLRHARGLGMELEYQRLLARDLHLMDEATHVVLRDQTIEVRHMLSGVINRHFATPV